MWTMGPKIKGARSCSCRQVLRLKYPTWVKLKRGPLGPQSSNEEANCGCAWCYTIYIQIIARSRYHVHMYIGKQAQVNFVHKDIYVQHGRGGPWPPPIYFLGASLYTIFTAISGTRCSTKQFSSHGPPRPSSPPGAHVMGESSHCPRPTGTNVLK